MKLLQLQNARNTDFIRLISLVSLIFPVMITVSERKLCLTINSKPVSSVISS
jgi:hypothetical protein